MSFAKFLPIVCTLVFLVNLTTATYSSSSRSNVAVYWGQGPGQLSLSHYCQQSTIDIVALAFMHVFPAQGNGFPGTNFGNQCSGATYAGPGDNPSQNQLQSQCPQMVADIPVCQNTYGKKIILSLGGGTNTYQLTGADNGVAFADFLWGAFGPQNSSWIASGLPRPFDGSNGQAVVVDGFDFDIEYQSTDNSAGYIALINRLRSHFAGASKQYLITGAPQCVVPDANMGTMISKAQFDIIWVQFYNTPYCSARTWANANPNYNTTHTEVSSGFSYNDWSNALVGTASANAKLWIGLSGSASATGDPSFLLSPAEVSNLAAAYYCKPNFGGILIWEATYAESNVNDGSTYYQSAKNILLADAQNPALTCNGGSTTSRTTSRTTSTRTITSSRTLTTISTRYSSSTRATTSSTSSATSKSSTTTGIPTRSSSSSTSKSSTTSSKISTSSNASSTSTKPSSTRTSTTKSAITSSISSRSSSTSSSFKTSNTSSSVKSSTTSKSSSTSSTLKPTTTSSKISTTSKASSQTTSKTSSTKSATTTYPPAPVGACGPAYMVSCSAGYCCSASGYCGQGAAWCGAGCQPEFGVCS